MSRQYTRTFGVPAIVLAAFFVACTDPPKLGQRNSGNAGAGAVDAVGGGSDETGGSDTSSAGMNASGTSNGGGAEGGEAGSGGDASESEAGDTSSGGTSAGGGDSGGTSAGGGDSGGTSASGGDSGGTAAGRGGALGGNGGLGSGGGTGGGVGWTPTCAAATNTTLPTPPAPATAAPKPSGAPGGLKVVNWAGFKGAISYTFDDSLASQVAHYDQLNAVGVPMTFYLVCHNAMTSTSTWAKAVADGHELGNHTYHHCNADGTNCGFGGVFWGIDRELDDCTAYMKTTFGLPGVYTFAAPMGDGNWAVPASSRFMVNRGVSDFSVFPNDQASAYNVPCHIANLGETAADIPGPPVVKGFNAITDDVRVKGSWRTVLAHNVDPAITDYGYHPVQLAEIVAAMTYTKSLGDVWADTVVSVGSYWLGQRALNNLQPTTVGTDKVYSWTLPAHFPPGHHLRVTVSGGTPKQCGNELPWDDHGYYEISLDAGSLTISP